MEFRLIYRGPLPAETSRPRTEYKHRIRKQLHQQLKELRSQYRCLSVNVDYFSEQYRQYGFRFVPLVSKLQGYTCSLDILFLRRDAPGNMIRSGGDIDNRIKVLFDGLRIPASSNELGGAVPEKDEDPFFCLLEDDALITEVNITTDRLLLPRRADEHLHDVLLVIRVTTKIPNELFEVTF